MEPMFTRSTHEVMFPTTACEGRRRLTNEKRAIVRPFATAPRGAAVRSRSILTYGRWAFALGALAFGVMPRAALAAPRVCIPPGDRARCERDYQCCEGAVCAGVCRSGCKINKTFYPNGWINEDNDCQWCQAATNRFGWTNFASGTACGDQTDDECTNPDTCDGSGACLANHEPTTTTCGDAEGPCTNQDYCDGSGGCTDNEFKSASTACGSDADTECDNPDHCSGTDGNCVPNYETAGATCGDDEGACTYADECDEAGGCTDNGFKSAATACGSNADTECDNPDHCTGGDGSCVNEVEPTSTTCSDAGGPCTNQDYCNGSGGCTNNGFKAATTACGDQTDNVCDNPDHCSGVDGSCVNEVEPTTTTCGDAGGPCTNQDYCNGLGGCTNNGFKPGTTACGNPTNDQCNNPDHCSGSDGSCVPDYEPAGTACGDAEGACIYADACDGSGGCTNAGFKPATTHCTGTANGGPCDNDAADHCTGTSNACDDAFKPSSHACVSSTNANNEYTCKDAVYCTGTSSTCPTPVTLAFDPSIPCRKSTGFCDPPDYCASYGTCSAPVVLPGGTCDGGLRDGEFCDDLEANPCGIGFACVRTVCPGATLPCEKPWTCDYSGRCLSNGFLPAGTDCIGDYACKKYSCDAAGNCVDQNVTRSPTALCRPSANECDQRDFCGNPSVVPSNGRYDFDDYPDCGPDEKKPWNTPCTYHPFGEDAPGRCSEGECKPYYCKNSIECPDGWVCGCPPGQVCPTPYCVPAPAEGGYGDVCTVRGYCSRSPLSWDPGRRCTSDADCSDVNHQGICHQSYCDALSAFPGDGCASDTICKANNHLDGKCITDTQGDCGSIPGRTLDYVCCAGMAGDGVGGRPALGVTGRCQECCGNGGLLDQNCTDQDDPGGTTSFQCCDGKCTDVVSDIHNCVSCNYDGSGVDCTNLIRACSPGVVECDAINIGSGCVMTEYCGATAEQNGWIAASCEIPEVRFPVPACDFCVSPLTLGTPCMTDADCGVLDGAEPPPPGPFAICLPGADCRVLDGITSWCYHDPSSSCDWARHYAYIAAPECQDAPFTGCTPICTELDNAPNVGTPCHDDRTCNDSGEVCETDGDCPDAGDYCIHECHGGTTCKTSCNLSAGFFGLSAFCFENPTCQW